MSLILLLGSKSDVPCQRLKEVTSILEMSISKSHQMETTGTISLEDSNITLSR